MRTVAWILGLSLLPSAALACSPIFPQSPQRPGAVVPDDGGIFVSGLLHEPRDALDPDGNAVTWAVEAVDWQDGVFLAYPEDGWSIGPYTGSGGGEFLTVVPGDEVAPPSELEITWRGHVGGPHSCSGTGVYLSIDDTDGLLHGWYRHAAFDDEPDGWIWGSSGSAHFVGVTENLGIRSFDSRGNSLDTVLHGVASCQGCSGSLVGAEATLASIPLVPMLWRRRQRRRPIPSVQRA